MSTMNISLPESMKAFVEQQVAGGGYSTASEYLRALIREAQKRRAKQELEAKLLKGLESGHSIEVNQQFWERKRALLQ